jgi:hypothetical protein
MWRISSSDGKRWVQGGAGTRPRASADMQGVLDADGPVEIAPLTGEFYTPAGPNDQTALFLRARNAVGYPQSVTGRVPRFPTPAAPPAGGVS